MEDSSTKEDEPCAYAKLWGQLDGKPFHTYLTALPSTLGRGSTATEGNKKPPGFIDLGRSKALSREHAEISWVPAQRAYQITCMSKNGMVVAGSYHAKGGKEKLESRAPIKLGPASMYFLLPETEAPAPAPAPAPAQVLPHEKSQPQPPSQASSQAQAQVQAQEQAQTRPQAQPQARAPAENGTAPVVASPAPTPTPTPTPAATQPPNPAVANPPAAAPAAASAAAAAAAAAAQAGASPMAELFTFADMVSGAFRSQELSAAAAAGGLSSGDLQNWIVQAHPEWGQEEARMKALAVGIEDALNKNFVSIGEDRWTVPPHESSAKRAKLSSPNNGTSVVAAAAAAAVAAAQAGVPPAAAVAPAGITPTPAPTPAARASTSPEAVAGENSSPAVSAAAAAAVAAAAAGAGFAAGGNGTAGGGIYGAGNWSSVLLGRGKFVVRDGLLRVDGRGSLGGDL
eukprot:g18505.t1